MFYNRKPNPVEAMLLSKDNIKEVYKFLGDKVDLSRATDGTFINVIDDDFHEIEQAHFGDYVVKKPSGRCSVWGAKEFERFYELYPRLDVETILKD